MDRFVQVMNLPFKYHLMAAALVRAVLITMGDVHDKLGEVPYTDVDYKVFTDAARHVVNGNSPYKRHTYRYSPLLAYLLVPNILVDKNFGKVIFSMFDLLLAFAVKMLVEYQLRFSTSYQVYKIAVRCTLFWLYNPLSIVISTRGNADSIPCFLIMVSLLYLQTDVMEGLRKYVISGVLLGISIHLRLYPVVFSFPMYLSLGTYQINRRTNIRDGILSLIPNKKQMTLASSCIFTLVFITGAMYLLYGYEFLFETYIYHLFRKDTRHNFSVLFYYSYLTTDHLSLDLVKTISLAFEFMILFAISLTFGCDEKTLPFALFAQAIVLVAYNSVMTSQYFIWFLSLLPIVIHSFKVTASKGVLLTVVWVTGQVGWLFYAYLVEFECRELFIMLWVKSIVFFGANIFVLCQLTKHYNPRYGFGTLTNAN